MDSLYEAPRRPPVPFCKEMLPGTPMVPEISVLCPSNTPRNVFTSYNQWRQDQHSGPSLHADNKENLPSYSNLSQNSSILKKQVRFESPVSLPEYGQTPVQKNDTLPQGALSFEHMYMANIPSRHLDLSVIDLPRRQPPAEAPQPQAAPEQPPKSYKEFLESQKKGHNDVLNDSVTDIFNYKRSTSVAPSSQTLFPNEPLKQFQGVSQAISQRTLSSSGRKSYNNDERLTSFKPNGLRESDVAEPQFQGADHKHRHAVEGPTRSLDSVKSRKCGCCSEDFKSLPVSEQRAVVARKTDDDLSAKDLLQIIAQQSQQIAQQNSQILLLQQQVSELVSMQKHQLDRQTTPCCQLNGPRSRYVETIQPERCISSTQHSGNEAEAQFFSRTNQEKNHLPNFAIGLTTSFEVSVRRPSSMNGNNCLPRNAKGSEYKSPKIHEITESESTGQVSSQGGSAKDTLVDASMVFKEPIQVRESCPSPEPSIKINMKDFDESDSDDDDVDCAQNEASFYKNLMTQVNKVLQKAQIETSKELANMTSPKLNHKTIHKVKETTLRHLRRIGVELQGDESSNDDSVFGQGQGSNYDQDDVSFMVKQLLMKYLPADHLAKVASKEYQYAQKVAPKGTIKSRPDFSIATLQYMEKYNLISSGNKEGRLKQHAGQSPKILDISNLKLQPKLL